MPVALEPEPIETGLTVTDWSAVVATVRVVLWLLLLADAVMSSVNWTCHICGADTVNVALVAPAGTVTEDGTDT